MNEVSIRLHIEPLGEDGFLATSPDVPGLVAEGRSITEAARLRKGLPVRSRSRASNTVTRFPPH